MPLRAAFVDGSFANAPSPFFTAIDAAITYLSGLTPAPGITYPAGIRCGSNSDGTPIVPTSGQASVCAANGIAIRTIGDNINGITITVLFDFDISAGVYTDIFPLPSSATYEVVRAAFYSKDSYAIIPCSVPAGSIFPGGSIVFLDGVQSESNWVLRITAQAENSPAYNLTDALPDGTYRAIVIFREIL
jgi:hypothetical protein